MIRFSVFYPAGDDSTFDHDYYKSSHVPLAADAWGGARYEIDKAVSGPYVAAVHFFFDSMEDFGAKMASEKTAAVMADVANYTNITPVTQISEIVA